MHRRLTRSRSCVVGAAGFALALLLATSSSGQESSADQPPLARYVPKDNLLLYLEYEGLDAHAVDWRKTAAYKILNNTPTGAMLEEVFAQVIGKIPNAKLTGPETLALLKHMARSGFVIAVGGDPRKEKPDYVVFGFRDAYKNKEVRPIFARGLNGLNAANSKPQAVVRAGHKVIAGTTFGSRTFSWWVEDSKKDDMVLVLPAAGSPDFVLETLDGKRPSVVSDPRRIELAKAENGFLMTGLAFVDPVLLQSEKIPAALRISDVKKFDFRWGFHDDALMSITRIVAPSPRKGLLALFDGSTFDKSKLPPIPESVSSFSVVSLDLKATMERVIALAKNFKPDAEEQVNKFLDSLKSKTRLRLKEDLLAHLGPRFSWYILPAKASTTTAAAPSNVFSTMMSTMGLDQIPKLAIVFDIDDPIAFGKVLDEAMAATNREFKSRAAKAAGDVPAARGARTRGPSTPTFEFRLMTGDAKMYVMSVPPDLSGQFPTSFRPAIRVGPKQAVIAVSADIARLVLETKGGWTPPSDLAPGYQGLASKLKLLDVSDPRETLPGLLASLPAKLQSSVNMALLLRSKPAVPGLTPAPEGAPGAPSVPSAPGSGDSGGRRPMNAGRPGGPTPGSGPGSPGVPGVPGGSPTAGSPFNLVLQIDAAKLPSADSIKALLFPSVLAVEVSGDEIRIISREAFPAFGDPSKSVGSGQIFASMMGLGGAPPLVFPSLGGTPPGGVPNAAPGMSRPGAGAAGGAGGGGISASRPD